MVRVLSRESLCASLYIHHYLLGNNSINIFPRAKTFSRRHLFLDPCRINVNHIINFRQNFLFYFFCWNSLIAIEKQRSSTKLDEARATVMHKIYISVLHQSLSASVPIKLVICEGGGGISPLIECLSIYGACFFHSGLWGYWHCGHSWNIVPASGNSEDDCGEVDGM
jgi:hypothetical protein